MQEPTEEGGARHGDPSVIRHRTPRVKAGPMGDRRCGARQVAPGAPPSVEPAGRTRARRSPDHGGRAAAGGVPAPALRRDEPTDDRDAPRLDSTHGLRLRAPAYALRWERQGEEPQGSQGAQGSHGSDRLGARPFRSITSCRGRASLPPTRESDVPAPMALRLAPLAPLAPLAVLSPTLSPRRGSRGVDQCRTEAAWRGASQARKSDETALPVR